MWEAWWEAHKLEVYVGLIGTVVFLVWFAGYCLYLMRRMRCRQ